MQQHPRQGQHCAACGKAFVFFPHERTGKLAPMIPADDGNCAVNDDGTYRIVKKGEVVDGRRYLNHFVDCPEAPRFHRDGRAR
jgi:hypothetical protein